MTTPTTKPSTPTLIGASMRDVLDRLSPHAAAAFEQGASSGERLPISSPLELADTDRIESRRRRLIPDRFQRIRLGDYRPQTPSQSAALEITRRFVARVTAGTPTLLALIGAQGTGKSHLLYGALHELLDADLDAFSRPWYRLADELRYGLPAQPVPSLAGTVHHTEPLEAHQVRSQMWRPKLVMLDEVRATASTALDENELAKFACHAYDNAVSVMVTTNVDPLRDVMGDPAASRFTQVIVTGPDHRQS